MIYITNAAQKHFYKLLLNQQVGTQIRMFVINHGKSNAECGVSYCSPDTIESTDIELNFDKFSVYIDKISNPYLQNAEIDYVKTKLGFQLTLKAPNVKTYNLSKDASLVERIKYLLQTEINPKLADHGGQIKLIEITDDMLAVLQFGGGCNGCSMANYTLKEWIEKELLKRFPELNGVSDFTKHKHGKHSYY